MTSRSFRWLGLGAAALALTAAGLVTAATAGAETTAPADRASAAEPDPRHWQRGRARPTAAAAKRSAADAATLTVSVRDRVGVAPSTDHAGYALAFDLATGALTVVFLTDGVGTAEVAPGSYLVQAFVETVEPGGETSLSMPTRSQVRVTGDTLTALDGRTTVPVGVAVDRAGARLAGGTVQVTMGTPGQQIWYAADFDYSGGVYMQPTGPVPGLNLDVYATFTDQGAPVSRYLYAVTFRSADGIPRRPVYAARTRDLAALTVRFSGQDRPGCGRFGVSGRDPGLPVGLSGSVTLGAVPGSYRAYVTPGTDVAWRLNGEVLPPDCAATPDGDFFALPGQRFPAAGAFDVPFGRAPLGPAFGNPSAAEREGDLLWIQIPMYSDAGVGRGGGTALSFEDFPYTTGRTVLSGADGSVLGTSDRTGFGAFEVGPKPARYELTTESTRDAPWSGLSAEQRTSWTFASQNAEGVTPLPLLAVRYDMALDDLNRAPAGPFTFGVFAEQNGAASAPQVAALKLEASFDDGKSWQQVTVEPDAGRWVAELDHPAGGCYVSLRATAADQAGNTVEQTTVRAYAVRISRPPRGPAASSP